MGETSALTLIAASLIGGCGKRAEQASAPPPAVEASSPTTQTPAETPPPNAAIAARVTNPQEALAQSQAALKAKDYETAAVAILAAQQQKQVSDQQALALRNQMIQLQRSLVAAVASGDPKAKAAAELLRASSH